MRTNTIKEDSDVLYVIRDSQLGEIVDRLWERMQDMNRERDDAERARTVTKAKACEMLGKNATTLWRWEKEGYLVPVKVGSRSMYRLGDIQDIMTGSR